MSSPAGVRRVRRTDVLKRNSWHKWYAAGVVSLCVLIGNAVYLLGIRTNDPLVYHSGLGSPTLGLSKAPFNAHHAAHTIDPNDGWTAQALGRLAAQMWSHGQVPYWNVHEGLGTPLAGEMQSAAFFLPFVLFQLLPNGIFVMHVVLELVAALSTLALLRVMGTRWIPAVMGGVLFGLNGTFALMTNAPFNPIAFLPLAVLGVELIRKSVQDGKRPVPGLVLTALACAWMLYAGFPETALLEGVFVGVWVIARCVEGRRRGFAILRWSMGAAVAGLAIAAPILVALKAFLPVAFTAYHSGGSSSWSYPTENLAALAMPFASGPMGLNTMSGGAGYVTLVALFLSILGFLGPRSRGLRVALGATFVLLLCNDYGSSLANKLINVIPGMHIVLVYKYSLVLLSFIVIVFAALGCDDLSRGQAKRSNLLVAFVISAGYLAINLYYGFAGGHFTHRRWTAAVLVWVVAVLLIVALIAWRSGKSRMLFAVPLIAALVAIDGMGTYMVPQLSAGRSAKVDTAPIKFLQDHLGNQKFFSLGPIQPNYGSYWGLSQLNVNDLPVPQKFRDFVVNELKPKRGTPGSHVTGWAFTSGDELAPLNFNVPDARGILRAYGQQQAAYREAGVKYLVMAHGVADGNAATSLGLGKVFSSQKTEIWEDSKAKTNLTTSDQHCDIQEKDSSSAVVSCPRPARLTRRQINAPGWYATVNGREVSLGDGSGKLYQSVALPSGRSTIQFNYRPAHSRVAVAISVAALLWLLIEVVVWLVRFGARGRKEVKQ